jgi:uncharacterized protein DUF1996
MTYALTRGARLAAVLLLTLALAAVYAASAQAEPRIKVNCKIYDTNRVDPIAYSAHLHHQFGNTSTTNQSTASSMLRNTRTSCDAGWFTAAGWFPVERNEPVKGVNVYYRAPGNQKAIRPIPTGLQLLAHDQEYNCNEGPFRDSPVYDCRGDFGTRLIFPDCWNQKSLQENTTVPSNNMGVCPASHPYRIPRINYLVMHGNEDGRVANPLQVSAGVDSWASYDSMHGDYFAANRPELNNELLDLCLRNQPDSATERSLPSRCG